LWASAANWAGGVSPTPGDDLFFPAGSARLTNTNNFAAATAFSSITFAGAGYTINGNQLVLTSGVTATQSSAVAGSSNTIATPIRLGAG
jgi:hypothetical protein